MRLCVIDLQNFFGIHHAHLDLRDKHLRVIAGPNGTGKSALFKAVQFFIEQYPMDGLDGKLLSQCLHAQRQRHAVTRAKVLSNSLIASFPSLSPSSNPFRIVHSCSQRKAVTYSGRPIAAGPQRKPHRSVSPSSSQRKKENTCSGGESWVCSISFVKFF